MKWRLLSIGREREREEALFISMAKYLQMYNDFKPEIALWKFGLKFIM